MATPRERVLTALEHHVPERVPFAWGFGPTGEMCAVLRETLAARGLSWDALRAAADDVVSAWPAYRGPNVRPGVPDHMGAWGIVTRAASYGGGSYDELDYCPLAGMEDPAALDTIRWPSVDDYAYDTLARQLAQRDPDRTHALRIHGGNPFEIYTWMTGIEESSINLVTNPDLIGAALERITTLFIQRFERQVQALDRPVDLAFCADDLGGQSGLLMSPATYRDVIQPYHAKLFAALRRAAPQARILYHTDGAVYDIIPDLLDAGIDCLEAVQTDAAGMDPARLKAAFGSRLSFHGGISVQALLPHGTPDEVRRGCRSLVATFGAGGGYIAAPSHAPQFGTPVDNILAMLEAVLGPEDYARALEAARATAPVDNIKC